MEKKRQEKKGITKKCFLSSFLIREKKKKNSCSTSSVCSKSTYPEVLLKMV